MEKTSVKPKLYKIACRREGSTINNTYYIVAYDARQALKEIPDGQMDNIVGIECLTSPSDFGNFHSIIISEECLSKGLTDKLVYV